MTLKTSILVAVTLVSLALTTHAQQQETPPKESTSSIEETEWENVNCFDTQLLQSFLQAFPSGKHTQDAKDALELNNCIRQIKEDKGATNYVIQFGDLGGGDAWAALGDVGFTGRGIHRMSDGNISVAYFSTPMNGGKTPGANIISFDSNGNQRVRVTDGSIVAFATDGLELVFYGGAKFKTPGSAPAFFAVIKGKGFVHLKGAVSVTIKGKATVDLE